MIETYAKTLAVFPTRVGVNRTAMRSQELGIGFPHPRGGEPFPSHFTDSMAEVFPTRVGVNRLQGLKE